MYIEKSKAHHDREVIVIEKDDTNIDIFIEFSTKHPSAILVANYKVYFSVRFESSVISAEVVLLLEDIQKELKTNKEEKDENFSN